MATELIIGREYKFAQISKKKVTVDEGSQQSLTFYEGSIIWKSEYSCIYHDEEDEESGIKKDVPRNHKWRTVIPRINVIYEEVYFWYEEGLWVVKIFIAQGADMILTFSTQEKAMRMYELVAQYIGIENY